MATSERRRFCPKWLLFPWGRGQGHLKEDNHVPRPEMVGPEEALSAFLDGTDPGKEAMPSGYACNQGS